MAVSVGVLEGSRCVSNAPAVVVAATAVSTEPAGSMVDEAVVRIAVAVNGIVGVDVVVSVRVGVWVACHAWGIPRKEAEIQFVILEKNTPTITMTTTKAATAKKTGCRQSGARFWAFTVWESKCDAS